MAERESENRHGCVRFGEFGEFGAELFVNDGTKKRMKSNL
jgi:hypothetical protein